MVNDKFNIMPYSYLKMLRYELKGLLYIFKLKKMFYKQAIFFPFYALIIISYYET